jgi:hypothetical protein
MLEEDIRRGYPEFRVAHRRALFALALEHEDYRPLLECFQGCVGISAKDANKASEVLYGIYKSLSHKIHGSKSAEDFQESDDKVDIDAGALSLPEARMLVCVAEHLKMPYQLLHEHSTRPEASLDGGSDRDDKGGGHS